MSLQSRPLAPARWLLIPALIAMAATVVFSAPIRVLGLQLPEPVFPLAPVFAWALIRPSVIAPFLILVMGAFLDILWGAPFGLWEISLLVTYGVVSSGRSVLMGQSDGAVQGWYIGASALLMVAALLVSLLLAESAPSLLAVLAQAAATAILYPFAAYLIARFEDADVRFR